MFDLNKPYEELVELRKKAVVGEVFEQLTKEIERIQQDTNNIQIADLTTQIKILNQNTNKYSNTSSRASLAMIALTVALVIFTSAQAAIAYYTYKSSQEPITIRKACYQSALQTSDIDKNYLSCLHSKGLNE